ncbi:MAG TPA: protein kinase [Bryobacteraceae bacterium]|nr:protein kinase [Bryobacteraceae bacterium]
MRPEVYSLFGELSGVPREDRERYYTSHSTSQDLRQEVESLISFDSGPPIGNIVHRAVGLAFQEPVTDGDFCGPFKLIKLIGRGGMGLVYLAERVDGEVRQRVAVKLLRAALDSNTARQRFLQERQILANLSHPNIARLVDAGHRPDGHPYLVMEYIEGQPIDDYSRELSIRERVALVATVCDAMASAHRNLVVHRDLKPGNILVDANGNPHILDFGIAKLMDVADATETIDRRLTPQYASPEQIAGGPVTTSTDIYSLGAVLYKLITGEAPEYQKPATLLRISIADRDLDAIVRKTIRVEPHERYATADQLAEDLRAWLEHRPVGARQGERWYRARRQFRRYWVFAAAGLVAAVGLIAGFVTVRSERDLAQERFEQARKLANEFLALDQDIQGLPGSAAVRERMVNTWIKYLEGLSKRAGNDWRLKTEIAAGYRRAAEAQGIFRTVNLGRPDDAQRSLNKAAALLTEVSAAAPGDRNVLHDLIELAELQMRIETSTQNLAALDAKIQQLQALLARYESRPKDDIAEWRFLGKIYESMTYSARDLSRTDVPMEFARRALELRRKAAQRDRSFVVRGALANTLGSYATMLRVTGDLSGAAETFQQSVTMWEDLTAENPQHYAAQVNLANTHALFARVLGDPNGPSLGQTDSAVRHLEESLRIGRRLMALDANEGQIRYNHSMAAWRLGDVLRPRNPRDALARYDEAVATLRALTGKPFNRDIPLAQILAESTFALRGVGRDAESESRIEEAARICEPYRTRIGAGYAGCAESISRAVAGRAIARGRPLEAVTAHREWLQVAEREKTPDRAKEVIHDAYVLTNRYRLLRESLLAAGLVGEADETDRKRRALVAVWKGKLSGRNDAEFLLQ